jgi:ATP-dependent DNA helicase RecQ
MEDDIKRILQDEQFHLQLKSEQKEIIQNVLERKDSMAVLPTGFGKSMCYVLPPSRFTFVGSKVKVKWRNDRV